MYFLNYYEKKAWLLPHNNINKNLLDLLFSLIVFCLNVNRWKTKATSGSRSWTNSQNPNRTNTWFRRYNNNNIHKVQMWFIRTSGSNNKTHLIINSGICSMLFNVRSLFLTRNTKKMSKSAIKEYLHKKTEYFRFKSYIYQIFFWHLKAKLERCIRATWQNKSTRIKS